jgi:hypothetical protein
MVASDADMWLMEAANAAKELMDSGPYSLYTTGDSWNFDYNALHRMLPTYQEIRK